MLAAHGTVTATAKALHYTPSAVSQQLRTLSDDLGLRGGSVRLKPLEHGLRVADCLRCRGDGSVGVLGGPGQCGKVVLRGSNFRVLGGEGRGFRACRSLQRSKLALDGADFDFLDRDLGLDGLCLLIQLSNSGLLSGELLLQWRELALRRCPLGCKVGDRDFGVGDGLDGVGLLGQQRIKLLSGGLEVGCKLHFLRVKGGDLLVRVGDLRGECISRSLEHSTVGLERGDEIRVLPDGRLQQVLLHLAAVGELVHDPVADAAGAKTSMLVMTPDVATALARRRAETVLALK